MDLPFTPIELVARNPARRIHRRWRVAAMRDLFGTLLIETQWGRIGSSGQRLVRAFADEAAAHAYVRALLRRRAGAVRRIAVAYR
ncbi:WGR domain-containing protein [Sphingomonas sp. 2R-10]|uniref:WGR domain-containing protein n=1 Tax=Sphingomonas sp. 2R-10 TaxID=3045148 RepID=UPI0024BB06D0|nr:WGR domain-containing protein [Sphingomonas sp. 2R-10]MDJ0276758.1 WGR domain-containing protein [Sphingomonas sp. 2R-10]